MRLLPRRRPATQVLLPAERSRARRAPQARLSQSRSHADPPPTALPVAGPVTWPNPEPPPSPLLSLLLPTRGRGGAGGGGDYARDTGPGLASALGMAPQDSGRTPPPVAKHLANPCSQGFREETDLGHLQCVSNPRHKEGGEGLAEGAPRTGRRMGG